MSYEVESSVEVWIKPNAKMNNVNVQGDILLIDVSSPPVKGKANKELISYLAEILKLNKNQIDIVSGYQSRTKHLKIYGVSKDDIFNAIIKYQLTQTRR